MGRKTNLTKRDSSNDDLLNQLNQLQEKFNNDYTEDRPVDIEFEVRPTPRSSALPPPTPEKTKYNPDQIVDIVTFIEHPFFCKLTPYPWQRLIFKCFYMNSEGNQDLKIDDIPFNERIGCKGCIWEYVKENEETCFRARKDGKQIKSIFSPRNSPCLVCNRQDAEVKNSRYESALENEASSRDEEVLYEELRARETYDNFTTERDLLHDKEFDQEIRKQVETKLDHGKKFQELLLVLGRRSGKSFMVAVIAMYEMYRLIMMGHPQSRYGLMEFDEISIINVAVSEEQAKKAIFSKIKQTVLASPFFEPYLGKDTELEMRFLTTNDAAENKRRAKNNINPFAGSLILKCGHSNAAGLVGNTCFAIIMDEVAAMAGDNPASGTDYKLYEDLKPSLATFGKDGKMMLLSNPKGPLGLLYDLYENRIDDMTTLIFRLATWLTNPNIDLDWLENQKRQDPQSYPMQFGAEFGAATQDPFLTEDQVRWAFAGERPRPRAEVGMPLIKYFCHLDPAETSDYYALSVVHTEPINGQIGPDGKVLRRIIVDHLHYWEPLGKNQPINAKEVEDYIIELNSKFRFAQVTFDQWKSQSSIMRLRAAGIKAEERQFNKAYNEQIYSDLHQLFVDQRICIYNVNTEMIDKKTHKPKSIKDVDEAKKQFTFLQKKWTGKRYKIEALTGYHDDICDAVAASAHEAMQDQVFQRLPRTKAVNLGGRWR